MNDLFLVLSLLSDMVPGFGDDLVKMPYNKADTPEPVPEYDVSVLVGVYHTSYHKSHHTS